MSRKAFKIRGIDDFERALEAIAYSSGKEDDTSDESSDSDTDSHYSGDADDVDLDVYQCFWLWKKLESDNMKILTTNLVLESARRRGPVDGHQRGSQL